MTITVRRGDGALIGEITFRGGRGWRLEPAPYIAPEDHDLLREMYAHVRCAPRRRPC